MPPFLLPPLDNHQGNAITKFPGNSELERGLSPYPWILTSKVHYVFQNPNYPSDASLNGPTVSAPLPPPPPPPPRPYPFVIPPKISVSPVSPVSPVPSEPGAALAVPPVGEALVPEFPVDKTISGLPTAVKFGPPLPLSEPKAPAAEPVPAPEPVASQFAPEPIGVAEPAAGHPVAPEPATLPSVAAAQLIPAEPTPGMPAENKAASGEPAVAQAIPVEPVVGPAAEVRPPALEPAGGLLPPAELLVSQSAVGKPIIPESTELKPEGAEPMEAKSGSQEPLPFVLYQVGYLLYC